MIYEIPKGMALGYFHGAMKLISLDDVINYFKPAKNYVNYEYCENNGQFFNGCASRPDSDHPCFWLEDNTIIYKYDTGSRRTVEFRTLKEAMYFWEQMVGTPILYCFNVDQNNLKSFILETGCFDGAKVTIDLDKVEMLTSGQKSVIKDVNCVTAKDVKSRYFTRSHTCREENTFLYNIETGKFEKPWKQRIYHDTQFIVNVSESSSDLVRVESHHTIAIHPKSEKAMNEFVNNIDMTGTILEVCDRYKRKRSINMCPDYNSIYFTKNMFINEKIVKSVDMSNTIWDEFDFSKTYKEI